MTAYLTLLFFHTLQFKNSHTSYLHEAEVRNTLGSGGWSWRVVSGFCLQAGSDWSAACQGSRLQEGRGAWSSGWLGLVDVFLHFSKFVASVAEQHHCRVHNNHSWKVILDFKWLLTCSHQSWHLSHLLIWPWRFTQNARCEWSETGQSAAGRSDSDRW